MDLVRVAGLLAYGIFALSLALIPNVSVWDYAMIPGGQRMFQSSVEVFEEIVPADYPKIDASIEMPTVTAEAVLVLDVDSKVPIYEQNAGQVLFPASTTKLMTALVAVGEYPMDQIVVMPDVEVYPSVMGLKPYERITVENALKGLLIASGNDAALALANADESGYGGFVSKMNQKAKELGLKNTNFGNPSGLPQAGHVTSARDLGHLTAYAMQNPFVASTVIERRKVVSGLSGERHLLISTNQLLGELVGLRGGKTGFTNEAGEVLVSLVERDGRRIVCVVLRSQDRFGDTKALVDWVFASTRWVEATQLSSQ